MRTPIDKARRVRDLLALSVAALAMVFLYGGIDYRAAPFSGWDLRSYLAMAEAAPGLARGVPRPFVYRLLGPYIVGLMPLREPVGFRLLTLLTTLVLVFLFYGYLASEGVRARARRTTCALLILNRNLIGYNVWIYFQVDDMLSLVYVLVLLWSLKSQHWAIWGVTLLLGAATRETALLMVPVAALYLWDRRAARVRWHALAVSCIPALSLFLLLRWLVPSGGGMGLLQSLAVHSRKLASAESWYRLIVNPFIPLSFLPLIYLGETRAFLARNRHLLLLTVLVFVSALFGQNDERLMAPAFIVFYPLIAQIIERSLVERRAALVVVLTCAFLPSPHHQMARFPLPSRSLTVILSLSSLVVVTAIAAWHKWSSVGPPD